MNDYEKAFAPSKELNDNHLEDLLKSGLNAQTINESGVKSSLNGDSLVFPIWDINKKNIKGTRARYNKEVILANKYPSKDKNETPKYRPSNGLGNVLFFPHLAGVNCSDIAKDISIPIFITEGEKKALKLTQEGYFCLGLFGVNNWHTTTKEKVKDKKGQEQEIEMSVPLPCFDEIVWKGRKVYIVYDSDKYKNGKVLKAETKLFSYLKRELNADVKIINLPYDENAKGVDDFFVKHSTSGKKRFDELIEMATSVSLGYLTLCDLNKETVKYVPNYLAEFLYKNKLIINTNTGLFIYRNGFYKHLEKDQSIRKNAVELLKYADIVPTAHTLNETIKMLETHSFTPDEIVNPSNMHNVLNGTLEIDYLSGEVKLLEHTSKHNFTYIADVEFIPDCNTMAAEDFLNRVIPDKNQQVITLETLAFGVFPGLRQHLEFAKVMLLQGEGSNGKTIFINFCKRVIGSDACSSTSLDQLLNKNNRFMPITLYKKRANFSTENDSVLIRENSVLKAITSGKPGDELTIEQKHKPAFPALVNPILMMALNKEIALPANRTFALERRIQIATFSNKFSKNPKDGELQADNNLENYEYTKPIVNGLLNLVLRAIKEMIKRDSIWQEGVTDSLQKAILRGSHKERFIHEYIALDPEAQETSEDIHAVYVKYCLEEGHAQEHQNKNGSLRVIWLTEKYDDACRTPATLSKYLKARFKKQVEDTFISPSNGRRIRGFKGIRLVQKNVDNEPFSCANSKPNQINEKSDGVLNSCTDKLEHSFENNLKPEFIEKLKGKDATKHS